MIPLVIDLNKGISEEMARKYPGGFWRTEGWGGIKHKDGLTIVAALLTKGGESMQTKRPKFMDSEYFIGEPFRWRLKPGAPPEVVKEFNEFMNLSKRFEEADIEKGIGQEMLQKYPGGRWVTMSGSHVYIKEDGEMAEETDPRNKDRRNVKEEADGLYDQPPQKGAIYRYRNSTVVVESVGRSWVKLVSANGKQYKVAKSKFAKEADKIEKPSAKQKEKMAEALAGNTKMDEQEAKAVVEQAKTEEVEQAKTEEVEQAKTEEVEQAQKERGAFTPVSSNITEMETVDDLEAAYAEWKKHGHTHFDEHMPRQWFPVELARQRGNPAAKFHKLLSVNDKDGKPVGMSYIFPEGDYMYIQYAEAHPKHRKDSNNKNRMRGIGALMVAQAIQQSYDDGFSGKVRLTSLADRKTQDFYKALGFKNIGGLEYAIEGADAKKALEFLTKKYGSGIQKSLSKSEDLDWERILELEDALDGFIVGDISARISKRMNSYARQPRHDFEGGEEYA